MSQLNCWDFKVCGREPEGSRVEDLGVCPAALDESSDGINGGENAGRYCWAVSGTLCAGLVQGTFAKKILSCMHCDFLKIVQEDEGDNFIITRTERENA